VGQHRMKPTKQALIELPQACDADIRPVVEAELQRIKKHSLFKDTTRMKRFLEYVVTESLEGRESRLKGYAIGLEVFDRPDDFDPQADTIVRVQAGQLRRRLDLYYSGDGKNSPVRIVIPKGRYSPVFEIRRNVETGEVQNAKATVAFIEKQNRPGVVVLTFQNLVEEQSTNYFAEGITAEIVNALVQFRYIRVVARTASVLSDNVASSKLSTIAEKYNVQFALTGNIRRSGNLIRVSVNLISVETGEHLYSKIFDREYTTENLFDIQEEIASYVAANIAAPYGAINRYNRRVNSGRQSSLTAYESFLKYYEMDISPTSERAMEILEELDSIIDKTPRFSSAWAVKSLLNSFLVTLSIPTNGGSNRLETALNAAIRACAIDPENGLAYRALFQAYYHSGQLEDADNMAAKAISFNPNDYNMLAYYGMCEAFQGRQERAASFQNAAMELVGSPPPWFYMASMISAFQNKDFDKITKVFTGLDMSVPAGVQFLVLSSLGHMGEAEKAKPFLKDVLSFNPHYGRDALETFGFWHPQQDIYDLAISGWRKAGLDIPGG